MSALQWETVEELDQKLANRVKIIRKRRSISQQKLAVMSNVSYGSIKRFESTGQISLYSLTKIAMALHIEDDLRNLFTQVPYRNCRRLSMNKNNVIQVFFEKQLVGQLTMHGHNTAFEYDEEWLNNGFPISPFSLPLEKQSLYLRNLTLVDCLAFLQIVFQMRGDVSC